MRVGLEKAWGRKGERLEAKGRAGQLLAQVPGHSPWPCCILDEGSRQEAKPTYSNSREGWPGIFSGPVEAGSAVRMLF